MRYKKYVAPTLKEAVLKMRIDAGNDAVLIEQKSTKKGGFFGMFGKDMIEITAGIFESNIAEKTAFAKRSIEKKRPDPINNQLETELAEIKDQISKLMTTNVTKVEIPEDAKLNKLLNLMDLLKKSDVDDEITKVLMSRITKEVADDDLSNKEIVKEKVKNYLIDILKTPEPIKLNGKTKLIFMVGPTGVGKTTTLAKLCAKFVLKEKKNVRILSFDNYRIGASQQLKTYAEIIKTPLDLINDKNEFKEAIKDIDGDLVFVDTAGRSQKDIVKISELKSFINLTDGLDSEIHLVVSATTKIQDLREIFESYGRISFDKIIFTKLDETTTAGTLITAIQSVKKPLSYVTFGQDVAKDIEEANPEKIVDTIISNRSYINV